MSEAIGLCVLGIGIRIGIGIGIFNDNIDENLCVLVKRLRQFVC